jgi:nucleoid-associated protein YgaU
MPIVLPPDSTPVPMLPHSLAASAAPAREAASHLHPPELNSATSTRPVAQAIEYRKHRIVDGDSLRVIALRYFDDESRAQEIAEINRNAIPNPALLPVGREILIPQ